MGNPASKTRTYDVTVTEKRGRRSTTLHTVAVNGAAKAANAVARLRSGYNSPKVLMTKRVITKSDGTLAYKRG
jgi:hypothetical protein